MAAALVPAPAIAPPALSRSWKVVNHHSSCYTDGNAQVDRSWQQQQLHKHSTKHKPSTITTLTISPFVACYNSGDVTLLNLTTGQHLHTITADLEDEFTCFTLSPDHSTLCTYSRRTAMLTVWALDTYKVMLSWRVQPPHTQPVTHLAYDPSGRYIASASIDMTVRVWDTTIGRCTHLFNKAHKQRISAMSFHPHIKHMELITADEAGTLIRWKLITQEHTVCAKEHLSAIDSITFTPSAAQMITAGRDKVLCIWDAVSDYKHIRTIPVYEQLDAITIWPHSAKLPIGSKEVKDEHSSVIVSAGEKGMVKLWDSGNGKCLYTFTLPAIFNPSSTSASATTASDYLANQVSHMFILPITAPSSASAAASFHLVVVTKEHNFYVYDPTTFTRLSLYIGHNDEILDVRIHPDDQRIIVATNSSQIRIFDKTSLAADLLSGHIDTVLSIDVSVDGRYVVSGSKDRSVRVWDLNDGGRCVSVLEGHTESVGAVSWSKWTSANAQSYIVSGARDRTIKVWDASALRQLPASSASASASASSMHLPCVVTRVAHDKDVNTVTISPNDKFIASGGEDKHIHLFHYTASTATLTTASVLKGHRRGVWSLRFSNIDKVLASASGDKTVKLWSLTDYTCLKTFEGHTGSIKSIAFITAGMQLMSAGDDSSIRLWMIKTNECLSTFSPPDHYSDDGSGEGDASEKIWALDVSRDGKMMVTGGTNSTLNIWKDVTAEEEQQQRVEKQQNIVKEQQLMNLIRRRSYHEAIHLALALKQPRRMYGVLMEMMNGVENAHAAALVVTDDGDEDAALSSASSVNELLQRVWLALDDAERTVLLIYVRDWNTNARTSRVANQLLSAYFQCFPPQELSKNKVLMESIPGMVKLHYIRTTYSHNLT